MLKAIETRYNGCRFRSRLEARWAVFFDTLGVAWEYEKEGFDLGPDGFYLPDFHLPRLSVRGGSSCWIEVKGANPTQEENAKCDALCRFTQTTVLIAYGPFPSGSRSYYEGSCNVYALDAEVGTGDEVFWDNDQQWTACPMCRVVGVEHCGCVDRLEHLPHCKWNAETMHSETGDEARIEAAMNRARGARFELGESG